MPSGSSPLPHAGHETTEADTHVDSCEDRFSDAGSTPAASTTLFSENQRPTLTVPVVSIDLLDPLFVHAAERLRRLVWGSRIVDQASGVQRNALTYKGARTGRIEKR